MGPSSHVHVKELEVPGTHLGFYEVVRVVIEDLSALHPLLWLFLHAHNATKARECAVSRRYPSLIFVDERDIQSVKSVVGELATHIEKPILTQVRAIEHYYAAPRKHQDYFAKDASLPYCQNVVLPKLDSMSSWLPAFSVV